MKTIKGFVKKYWITVLIFAGLVLLYHYVADVKMLNPYLFPTTEKIAAAFESNKEVMLTNMLASFKLLIPSVFLFFRQIRFKQNPEQREADFAKLFGVHIYL